MQKDPETGIVNNDKEKCIGCMTCEKSCPYGHPVQLDDGLSHKCVLCSDENPEGTPDPTCAKACPVRALEFGPIASLREAHPEGAAAIGELTDETGPAVVFALHRDADKGGTLRNPQEVGHEA
jgi:anaerobic dimethyl sulfoxide reductase subunit B (iron-sulfur subunit)